MIYKQGGGDEQRVEDVGHDGEQDRMEWNKPEALVQADEGEMVGTSGVVGRIAESPKMHDDTTSKRCQRVTRRDSLSGHANSDKAAARSGEGCGGGGRRRDELASRELEAQKGRDSTLR